MLIEAEKIIIHKVDDVGDLNFVQVAGVHGLVVNNITNGNAIV
jgi:hypothetical protein